MSAKDVADFLPCPARLSCLVHSRNHQHLGSIPNLMRCTHQGNRVGVAIENWGGEDLAELTMKLLTRQHERNGHASISH